MFKSSRPTQQFQKIARGFIRSVTLVALPVAGYAAVAFAAPPSVTEMSDSQLRYEAVVSLAATIGTCGVSANVLALTAFADSLPGTSLISKAAVNDDDDKHNEVNKALVETNQSVQKSTAVLGGILAVPIELLTDAVDFLRDGSLFDGEQSENQLGDQLNLAYSATREVLKTKMGENSKCRKHGERFESAVYEMSQRYYAPPRKGNVVVGDIQRQRAVVPAVIPPAPALAPAPAPTPGTSSSTTIVIVPYPPTLKVAPNATSETEKDLEDKIKAEARRLEENLNEAAEDFKEKIEEIQEKND